MKCNKFFEIVRLGDKVTKITNYSEYLCIFSIIPTPPKRKHVDRLIVKPNQFLVIDQPIDITRLSIRFEEEK